MPKFGVAEISVIVLCAAMLFGAFSLLPWIVARVIKTVQAELRKIEDA